MRYVGLLLRALMGTIVCANVVHAASLGKSAAENRQAIDACKSSSQTINYSVAGKSSRSIDAPASAEEESQLKKMMADAGMTYDPINRRATYQFVLGLIRANGVIQFQITPTERSAQFDTTRACLAQLAQDVGIVPEFVGADVAVSELKSASDKSDRTDTAATANEARS
jgi:hypothetical protein